MATPPSMFGTICQHLDDTNCIDAKSRIVLEKPIGHDVKLFEDLTNATGKLLIGPLAKFKNVDANEIAELMCKKARNPVKGVNYFTRMDV